MNNTLWALLERVVQILFGIVPFVLIARFFSKEDIAMYSIISMFLFNIWNLSSFNSRGIYIKYKTLYGEAFKRRFLFSFFVNKSIVYFIFGVVTYLYLTSLNYTNTYVVLSFLVLLFCFFETSIWDVECVYNQRKLFLFRLIVSFVSFVAKVIIILRGKFELVFIVLALEIFVFQFLFYLFRDKKTRVKLSFKFKNWLYFTKKTSPLFVSGILVFAYNRIDQMMLASLASPSQLADYSVVLKLIEPLNIIPTAIVATALPFIVDLKKSNEIYSDALKGYAALIFYISFFLALFFLLYGSQIVAIMFGDKYVDVDSLVSVLAICIPFSFIAVFNGMLLVFYDKQSLAPARALLGLSINLILNYILIPSYGAIGAALATLFTLIISGFALYLILPSTRKIGMLNLLSPLHISKIKYLKL